MPDDFDEEYVADLELQLQRIVPLAEEEPELVDVVERIVAAVKAEERKRGRHRIRQPGCADVAAYGWRRDVRLPPGELAPHRNPCLLLCMSMQDVARDRIHQAHAAFVRAEACLAEAGVQVREQYAALCRVHEQNIATMKRKEEKSLLLAKELQSNVGWKEMSSHSAIRTFYRKEGKGWHTCKIEGEIACPSFQVVALLREADLWSEWMPRVLGFGVTRTTPLDVTDKTNLALLTHIGFPWPFADRDISIRVDCVDSLDQHPRCVAVLMRDEPDTPINDGVVRCSIQDSGCLLTPYYKGDPEKTYCQFLIRIDVKIDVLPDFIIDGMFKNMSFLLLYQIRNAVKLVSDEKWAERYCHPDSPFYGWLRARIRDSLPEQCTTLPPLREGCNSALKGVDAMLLKSIVGGWISVAAVALIAVARHP